MGVGACEDGIRELLGKIKLRQLEILADKALQAADCGLRSVVCEPLMLRQENQAEQSRAEQSRADGSGEECECECKCVNFKCNAKSSRTEQSHCPPRVLLRCLNFLLLLLLLLLFFAISHHSEFQKFPHHFATLCYGANYIYFIVLFLISLAYVSKGT
ncbi:hypothetical protein CGRA01v4_08017 [Colletotrichum graminicola]|nr:hypothetical protein CGRA01v4_08017 [Colletotrichum graminicola]